MTSSLFVGWSFHEFAKILDHHLYIAGIASGLIVIRVSKTAFFSLLEYSLSSAAVRHLARILWKICYFINFSYKRILER